MNRERIIFLIDMIKIGYGYDYERNLLQNNTGGIQVAVTLSEFEKLKLILNIIDSDLTHDHIREIDYLIDKSASENE